MNNIYEESLNTAAWLRGVKGFKNPRVGVILGSGLGGFASNIKNPINVPYELVNGFAQSRVKGHAGTLTYGSIEGQDAVVMQGRYHYYEGHDMQTIGYPLAVMAQLGVENLIVTNAAGSLKADLEPGEVMLITDHLNASGLSFLRGVDLTGWQENGFLDCSNLYDVTLRENFMAQNPGVKTGVYVYVQGPTYETAVESKALRGMGGDCVGMSTASEAMFAKAYGMKTLGLSTITNWATGISPQTHDHQSVLKVAQGASEKLTSGLLKHIKNL